MSPARLRRLARWKHAFREITFIVVGVLIALAANAWWEERQDRHSERSYVLQLMSDTRENERILQRAIQEDSVSLGELVKLSTALRLGEPPAGSAMEMMGVALRYSDPRPVLGTLQHLVNGGRVELFQTDSLRSALMEYASLMHSDLSEQNRHVDLLLSSMRDWLSQQQAAGLDCGIFVEPSASVRSACDQDFHAAWPTLRGDPEFRAAVLGVRIATWNRVFYLDRMLRETRRLHAMLNEQGR